MDTVFFNNFIEYIQLLTATGICAGVIYLVYRRTSPNTTEEAEFASTILVLAVATAFLIVIIKHSFALSIGLIGILSIVRFRTNIQSPRRLLYIFIAVALGVGNGSGAFLLVAMATAVMAYLLLLFPIMPFDIEAPISQTDTARIVAKLTSGCEDTLDMHDVSAFLNRRNMRHQIKDASRTNDRTNMTIHFFDCHISGVDKALLAMKASVRLANGDLEFEIRNKSNGANGTSLPSRRGASMA